MEVKIQGFVSLCVVKASYLAFAFCMHFVLKLVFWRLRVKGLNKFHSFYIAAIIISGRGLSIKLMCVIKLMCIIETNLS